MTITYADLLAETMPSGMDVSDNYKTFLDLAFETAIDVWDRKTAQWLFWYQEDFVGDLISAYQVACVERERHRIG